ncbi:MAG: hypothetical protein IT349_09395 [Candidatus Eisenbacteria bacterium]|nr:hypothetical protein [Candidatus Eisenbacteria bacterium]MCC7142300.1 hypothetical protein [Candidatus Eisenbacteria bacterium]
MANLSKNFRLALVAAGVVVAGATAFVWTSNAGEGGSCSKAQAQQTNASCSAKATQASGGGCCASKATATQASTGACTGQATQASAGTCGTKATQASAGGCCASKGASQASMGACTSGASAGACGTMTAGAAFPAGTSVTRVDVPGGVDMIFAGNDLEGVYAILNGKAQQCQTECGGKSAGGASDCGATCSVTRMGNSVVLSMRGENAGNCCIGSMSATALQASGGACTSGASGCGDKAGACTKGASAKKVAKQS